MANTHSIDLELSSSQYLSITDGDQTGLDLSGDFTFECWIKFETIASVAANYPYVMGKYDWTSANISYLLWIDSDTNKLNLNVSDDGGTGAGHFLRFASTTTLATADTWVHIAATFDISAETCTFCFNGNEESGSKVAGTTIGATLHNGSAPFDIGSNYAGSGSFIDGKIDDVRVWNDIRSEAEIDANKDKELAGNEAGLVAYWKLNNSLLDETSNNNDLTNNNSAVFSTDVPFEDAGPAGVKTLQGLAIASVKTINGTAIASVKTLNDSAA